MVDSKSMNLGTRKSNVTQLPPKILKPIPIGFWASIKLSIQRLFKFCKCCENRRDKLSHAADKMVKEELKIVRWIQFMRCTDLALRKLFTISQWKEIEAEARFKTISIDRETNKEYCLNEWKPSEIEKEDSLRLESQG